MEVNITTKLKTAIIDAMLQLIPDTSAQTEALTSTIIEGTRATHKLRGDIKVAMATVQRLQVKIGNSTTTTKSKCFFAQ